MTVQELIDALRKHDREAQVFIWNWTDVVLNPVEVNVSESGAVWIEPGD
jgi:hypothetical protein